MTRLQFTACLAASARVAEQVLVQLGLGLGQLVKGGAGKVQKLVWINLEG